MFRFYFGILGNVFQRLALKVNSVKPMRKRHHIMRFICGISAYFFSLLYLEPLKLRPMNIHLVTHILQRLLVHLKSIVQRFFKILQLERVRLIRKSGQKPPIYFGIKVDWIIRILCKGVRHHLFLLLQGRERIISLKKM